MANNNNKVNVDIMFFGDIVWELVIRHVPLKATVISLKRKVHVLLCPGIAESCSTVELSVSSRLLRREDDMRSVEELQLHQSECFGWFVRTEQTIVSAPRFHNSNNWNPAQATQTQKGMDTFLWCLRRLEDEASKKYDSICDLSKICEVLVPFPPAWSALGSVMPGQEDFEGEIKAALASALFVVFRAILPVATERSIVFESSRECFAVLLSLLDKPRTYATIKRVCPVRPVPPPKPIEGDGIVMRRQPYGLLLEELYTRLVLKFGWDNTQLQAQIAGFDKFPFMVSADPNDNMPMIPDPNDNMPMIPDPNDTPIVPDPNNNPSDYGRDSPRLTVTTAAQLWRLVYYGSQYKPRRSEFVESVLEYNLIIQRDQILVVDDPDPIETGVNPHTPTIIDTKRKTRKEWEEEHYYEERTRSINIRNWPEEANDKPALDDLHIRLGIDVRTIKSVRRSRGGGKTTWLNVEYVTIEDAIHAQGVLDGASVPSKSFGTAQLWVERSKT